MTSPVEWVSPNISQKRTWNYNPYKNEYINKFKKDNGNTAGMTLTINVECGTPINALIWLLKEVIPCISNIMPHIKEACLQLH